MHEISKLVEEYNQSPKIFHAGRYWKAYEAKIIKEIKRSDINELRSGKYPIFGTFGFNERVYNYHPNQAIYKKLFLKTIRFLNSSNIPSMPYSLRLSDIREMAYNHCLIQGELANIKPISEIETSSFGNPQDIFEINGKKYTMAFMTYYIRLCYAQKYLKLKGNETIVELGSGSGHQVEILKKIFPGLTIVCFDLPYPLYLCNIYLKNVLGQEMILNASEGIKLIDINQIKTGKVNFLGNWQFPLLKNFKFDIFWNAASFGEMEPDIVQNYLSYVLDECKSIYLLQARHGKESSKNSGVVTPISFEDYNSMLNGFKLINESQPFQAHRKLVEKIGYFHAVWQKEE